MSDPVFFAPSRSFSVAEIAELTGASLQRANDAERRVTMVAPLSQAREGALVFMSGRRSTPALTGTRATCLLCTAELAPFAPQDVAILVSRNPQRAFGQIGRLLYPDAATPASITGQAGISQRAAVDPSAVLEEGVVVEPGAVIGAGAEIGSATIISANAVIGRSCRIGRDCFVGPNAVVQHSLVGNRVVIHAGAKIGQDGFGFAPGPDGPERMPQIGRVVIQDNVEIGANSTIDRGAMSDTVIGENTKIDNLVQIAHNVRLGRGCLIAGRTGISGSVTVGDGVMMGGGVGLADHLTIGDGAQLAAGSGFMHSVPAGEFWGGFPAKPMVQTMREFATLAKLAKRRPGGEKKDG